MYSSLDINDDTCSARVRGGKCGKYIKITGVSLRSCLGAALRQDMGFLLFSQYSWPGGCWCAVRCGKFIVFITRTQRESENQGNWQDDAGVSVWNPTKFKCLRLHFWETTVPPAGQVFLPFFFTNIFVTCEDERVIHHGQLNGLHHLIDGSGELSAAAVLTYLNIPQSDLMC